MKRTFSVIFFGEAAVGDEGHLLRHGRDEHLEVFARVGVGHTDGSEQVSRGHEFGDVGGVVRHGILAVALVELRLEVQLRRVGPGG